MTEEENQQIQELANAITDSLPDDPIWGSELAEALYHKGCIRLPCKIGDKMSVVHSGNQKYPFEYIVSDISAKMIDNEFIVFVFDRIGNGGRANGNGRIVFFTREEAEIRLMELEECIDNE